MEFVKWTKLRKNKAFPMFLCYFHIFLCCSSENIELKAAWFQSPSQGCLALGLKAADIPS